MEGRRGIGGTGNKYVDREEKLLSWALAMLRNAMTHTAINVE